MDMRHITKLIPMLLLSLCGNSIAETNPPLESGHKERLSLSGYSLVLPSEEGWRITAKKTSKETIDSTYFDTKSNRKINIFAAYARLETVSAKEGLLKLYGHRKSNPNQTTLSESTSIIHLNSKGHCAKYSAQYIEKTLDPFSAFFPEWRKYIEDHVQHMHIVCPHPDDERVGAYIAYTTHHSYSDNNTNFKEITENLINSIEWDEATDSSIAFVSSRSVINKHLQKFIEKPQP